MTSDRCANVGGANPIASYNRICRGVFEMSGAPGRAAVGSRLATTKLVSRIGTASTSSGALAAERDRRRRLQRAADRQRPEDEAEGQRPDEHVLERFTRLSLAA